MESWKFGGDLEEVYRPIHDFHKLREFYKLNLSFSGIYRKNDSSLDIDLLLQALAPLAFSA